MKTSLFAVAVLAAALTSVAEPTVEITRVQQRYPWNGLVDIDYAVSGVDSPTDYSLSFHVSAPTATGTETFDCARYSGSAACDLPADNGAHRVTWDANADGATFVSDALKVTARISYTPFDEALGDFAIVDLSGGALAAEYPVKFVKGGDPTVFNLDVYKTTKLVLRRVPGGVFRMGTEDDLSKSTSLGHYVKISKDYYLGLFPLTVRQALQIRTLASFNNNMSQLMSNVNVEDVDRSPADNLTREDAYATANSIVSNLCARAKCRGQSLVFSAPTEAQWERAARAETLTKFFWGTVDATSLGDYAWYKGNCSTAQPVGTREPSPWGLYDVYGNCREWTMDRYLAYPLAGAENPIVDPLVTEGDNQFVRRGGNFGHEANTCNSNFRINGGAEGGGGRAGIRLALWLH